MTDLRNCFPLNTNINTDKSIDTKKLEKKKGNVFAHSHVGMKLEVSGLVTDGEVVLRHLGLGGVEAHLVTGEPALVAHDGSSVDGGTGEVKVDVTAQVDVLTLVGGLNFAALLAVHDKHLYFIFII